MKRTPGHAEWLVALAALARLEARIAELQAALDEELRADGVVARAHLARAEAAEAEVLKLTQEARSLLARIAEQQEWIDRVSVQSTEAATAADAAETRNADLYEKYQEHARDWDADREALTAVLRELEDAVRAVLRTDIWICDSPFHGPTLTFNGTTKTQVWDNLAAALATSEQARVEEGAK
jgi:hypothetical protein